MNTTLGVLAASTPVTAGVVGTTVTGNANPLTLTLTALTSLAGYAYVFMNRLLEHHVALRALAHVGQEATLGDVSDLVVANRADRLKDAWVRWRPKQDGPQPEGRDPHSQTAGPAASSGPSSPTSASSSPAPAG